MRFLFWSFFFITLSVFGQDSFELKGTVTDSDDNPILIGDALLYDEGQVQLIQYAIITDGSFDFGDVPTGIYQLKISALGFTDYGQTVDLSKNRKISIRLLEETTQLENVDLVASKNPITTTNGNIKIDVTNPIFASMVDPLDVLSRLPNIQISPDRESISVIAKGTPLIYLGKQRIDFEEFLALSVDAIQSIEIINNPSPKYEAEGRAVVLINLKTNIAAGTTVNLSETLSIKRNLNNLLSGNGNHSNGKWNLRANLNYNQLGQWESNSFEFNIPSQNIFSDYLVLVPLNNRTQINGGLGVFLPLKGEDYISLNATLRSQTDKAPIETETLIQTDVQQDFILTETANDNSKVYQSANFNFNKKIGKKLNLFTGVQFSKFTQKLDSEISNDINGNGFQLDQNRDQEYAINAVAIRMDFEHMFSDNTKAEFGASWNNALADAFTLIQESLISQENRTWYDYKESIQAAYFNLSSSIGEKISFNAGVRTEENRVEGVLNGNPEPLVDRANFRFFPKAGFNYQMDSTKTISLNYARAINRPNFSRTSTISVFINPFLEGTNNINILPTLTQEVSANLQIKKKSLFMGFYQNDNPVTYAISYEEGNTAATLSPINLDRERGLYIGATVPLSHKKWTATNTFTMNYNKMEDDTAEILEARPYVYAYSNHQFRIANDTVVSFGGWFMSKRREGIYQRNQLLVLEASMSKSFGPLECALRFNDITRAMNFEERYSINGVEADGVFIADAQEMAFSVKYNFGKGKSSKFKNRDIDENLDRIN